MAKNELLQNWNGMQVLSNDHVPELEQEAYMQEAAGVPRDAASQQVYQNYKRKHLVQAAAFHLKAMKAAQGMGSMQEAQKHMLTYGLCVQALGLDPYGAVPPEIGAASQDPNLQIAYKFQAHPADAFLLGGNTAQTQPQGGDMGMTKHEIGHEIYKVLKKATEVLEGAAQADGTVPGVEKSEFTDKIQAARTKEANVSRDEAGLSYHLNGPNAHAAKYQAKYKKLDAKNRREQARKMAKSDLSPFVKAELEGFDNGAPCQDCGKNPCVCGGGGEEPEQKNPGEGNAAPSQPESGGESKASSGTKGDAFSTTLTGADNAMGKPSSIPDVDFSTTLEGMDSDMKAGSIPDVPFSTTLEGNDAAGVEKSEFTDKLKAARDQKAGELKQDGKTLDALKMKTKNMRERGREMEKDEFKPTNAFAIKLGYAKKHEILHGIHEIGMGLLMKMGAYDMAAAQDMTSNQYNVQPQTQHPYAALQGWTPAQTSVGPAALKQADGGGVYSIHNIGSRHHVIHSDAQGNITPLGIHGDTRAASGMDLAMGAVAHHELMSRGGTGQVTGAQATPAPLMRSEISEIQMQLAPIYKSMTLAKHDEKHNVKISRAMGGKRFMDEQGNVYNTLGEAAERLGLQASHIDEVLHGRRDQTSGHVFKFID